MNQTANQNAKTIKKWLLQVVKILISAGIIYWLVSSGKLNFKAISRLFSWQLGPLAMLLILITLFLASERWRLLLKTQNLRMNSWPMFKLSLIGGFFNFAMPGGVGGDIIKAYYFSKDLHKEQNNAKVIALTSVLMDRVLGLYAMIMMALLVMFYDLTHVRNIPALESLFYLMLFLFFAFTAGLIIVFSKDLYERAWLKALLSRLPFSDKTLKLYESMHLYGHNGKIVLVVIGLSFVAQTCSILFLALAGAASGIDVPIKTYFLVAPLGFMATAIPISPAGVGIGQAAFYFLFNLYTGRETDLGPTSITAYQMAMLIFSLVGAFYYLRRTDRHDAVQAAKDSSPGIL